MTIYDKHSFEGAQAVSAVGDHKNSNKGRKHLRRTLLTAVVAVLAIFGVTGAALAQGGDSDQGDAVDAVDGVDVEAPHTDGDSDGADSTEGADAVDAVDGVDVEAPHADGDDDKATPGGVSEKDDDDIDGDKASHDREGRRYTSSSVLPDLLDLSEDEILDRLDDGATLAEIAEDRGVSERELVDALVDAAVERAESYDKILTDDEVDELRERITARVNGESRESAAEAANARAGKRLIRSSPLPDLFDLSEDEIYDRWFDGETLLELAADNGVSERELTDVLEDAAVEWASRHGVTLTTSERDFVRGEIRELIITSVDDDRYDDDRERQRDRQRGRAQRRASSERA